MRIQILILGFKGLKGDGGPQLGEVTREVSVTSLAIYNLSYGHPAYHVNATELK